MIGLFSLVPLGVCLAELLLQVSAVADDPTAGGAIALVKKVHQGRLAITALRKQDGKAFDTFGREIASRLEAKVAGVRRRCEEQEVDTALLRSAVTEVEILLAKVVADDDAVVTAVREPDRFEEVLRQRARSRRQNVEEAAEPFFDELVTAVAEEFTRLALVSPSFSRGALKSLLDKVEKILHLLESNGIKTVPPHSYNIRFGSRPMEAIGFISRREQEALLDAVFGRAEPRTMLVGMHGSGKSQLSTVIAARCEAEGWPIVAWINAESRETTLEGFSELGRSIGVDVSDERTPERLAQRCLDALASADGTNRLIVLDNVENPDGLRGFIPRGEGLRVLATTTRRADWGQARWTQIPVEVFEREQSIGILLGRTNQADRETADVIAELLGDLPVAVSQAAAMIKYTRCSLADYLEQLREYSLKDSVRRLDGDEYPKAVGAALQLAFQSALEQIGRQSRHQEMIAGHYLRVLSLLAASGVPTHWLEAAEKESFDAREAVSALAGFSICQFSEDGSKTMLHRLQGRVIRESRENDPAERERAEKEAVGLLESVDITRIRSSESNNRRRETLDLADQLRAAAEQKYSRNLFADPRIGNILASALWYTTEFGAPQAALSLSDAVEHLGEVLGPDHPDTLTSRNNLAYAHESAGRLDQAIPLYEQTLADRERILGPDHPDTLTSRNNLAVAHQAAGRLDQAIALYEQTLTDRERILGPDHPSTLTSRNNLAGAHQAAGRLDQAIPLYEQTLTDSLRILGPDHPNTLTSRNNLAYAHQAAGRLDQAIALYEQTLTDSLRILGPDHPNTKIFRNNLASAYQAAGRSEDATALFDPPPDSGAADADRPDE